MDRRKSAKEMLFTTDGLRGNRKGINRARAAQMVLRCTEKDAILFPKTHEISYVQLALTLMWYKLSYPELYAELTIL